MCEIFASIDVFAVNFGWHILYFYIKSISGECLNICLQNGIMVTTIAITESWIFGNKFDNTIIWKKNINIYIYNNYYNK